MTILVSGASGLIGQCVVSHAVRAGHDVIRLVRTRELASANGIYWNPDAGEIDIDQLNGIDCVVHLAGKNVAAGRWNAKLKDEILQSRVKGTRLLAETFSRIKQPPKTFIMASAVGYYGDRGDELLHENSAPGEGFLSEVCQAWEAEAQPLIDAKIRTVKLRIGVVLTHKGGALPKMLSPFKMGMGGKIGNGRQYMAWITLEDLIGLILFVIDNDNIAGPINAVAPQPVTNAEFTQTLGKTLNRPTFMSVPAAALKLAVGDMAEELLKSSRAVPTALTKYGYQFTHPDLETALQACLDPSNPEYNH